MAGNPLVDAMATLLSFLKPAQREQATAKAADISDKVDLSASDPGNWPRSTRPTSELVGGTGPGERMSGFGAEAMTGRYSSDLVPGPTGTADASELGRLLAELKFMNSRIEDVEKSVFATAKAIAAMNGKAFPQSEDETASASEDDEDEKKKRGKEDAAEKAAQSDGSCIMQSSIRDLMKTITGEQGRAARSVSKPPDFGAALQKGESVDDRLVAMEMAGASWTELLNFRTMANREAMIRDGGITQQQFDRHRPPTGIGRVA